VAYNSQLIHSTGSLQRLFHQKGEGSTKENSASQILLYLSLMSLLDLPQAVRSSCLSSSICCRGSALQQPAGENGRAAGETRKNGQKWQHGIPGKTYCNEASCCLRAPLVIAHSIVRRVRIIEAEVRPLGEDSFKAALDASRPLVVDAEAEAARPQRAHGRATAGDTPSGDGSSVLDAAHQRFIICVSSGYLAGVSAIPKETI
jgi:hypothetical protein